MSVPGIEFSPLHGLPLLDLTTLDVLASLYTSNTFASLSDPVGTPKALL